MTGHFGGGDDELEKRIERLERQMERLSEQLDKLLKQSKSSGWSGGSASSPGWVPLPAKPKSKLEGLLVTPPKIASGKAETMVRSYKLPKGKLEAITKLMIRQDVPIVVSPKDDRIDVHATPMQHHIFKAFVDMINSKDEKVDYKLPKGKLEALTKLMVRNDVPILVGEGKDRITVHGDTHEQAIFKAFVDMVHSPEKVRASSLSRGESTGGSRVIGSVSKPLLQSKAEAAKAMHEALKLQQQESRHQQALTAYEQAMASHKVSAATSEAMLAEIRSKAEGAKSRSNAFSLALETDVRRLKNVLSKAAATDDAERLEMTLKQVEAEVREMANESGSMVREARSLDKEARSLAQEAVKLEREADSFEGNSGRHLLDSAKVLEREAAVLEKKADAIEQAADKLEAAVDKLNETVDQLREQARQKRKTER